MPEKQREQVRERILTKMIMFTSNVPVGSYILTKDECWALISKLMHGGLSQEEERNCWIEIY